MWRPSVSVKHTSDASLIRNETRPLYVNWEWLSTRFLSMCLLRHLLLIAICRLKHHQPKKLPPTTLPSIPTQKSVVSQQQRYSRNRTAYPVVLLISWNILVLFLMRKRDWGRKGKQKEGKQREWAVMVVCEWRKGDDISNAFPKHPLRHSTVMVQPAAVRPEVEACSDLQCWCFRFCYFPDMLRSCTQSLVTGWAPRKSPNRIPPTLSFCSFGLCTASTRITNVMLGHSGFM